MQQVKTIKQLKIEIFRHKSRQTGAAQEEENELKKNMLADRICGVRIQVVGRRSPRP
jgi:hypothetical protein